MKVLSAIGALFAVLGLLCGFLLLWTPLMVPPVSKTLSLTILAIGLCLSGVTLAGMGGKIAANRILRVVGLGLMLQAVLAVLGLIGDLTNLLVVPSSHLWWMMAGGCLCLGALALLLAGDGGDDGASSSGGGLPSVRL